MDNTTEQINTQEGLTPEEAKASLGLSTRLSEQFLMSQVPQAPQEGQMPQGEESSEEPKEDATTSLEGKMDEKMEVLRSEMKETLKVEINSIKEMLKEALDEEE